MPQLRGRPRPRGAARLAEADPRQLLPRPLAGAGARAPGDLLREVDGPSLYRTIAAEDPLPYSDSLYLDFLSTFTVEDVWAVLDRLKTISRVPLVLVYMEG